MASPLRYGPEKYELGALPDYQEGVVPKPGRPSKEAQEAEKAKK
jgi:hypothetical protein